MYSDAIPPLDEPISLPPPREVAAPYPLPGTASEGMTVSHKMAGSEITTSMCEAFGDSQVRAGILELMGISAKVGEALHYVDHIPYLNLLVAPTFLAHSTRRAYERFKVMHEAIKAKESSEALFWGARAVSSTGVPLCSLEKSVYGALQVGGVAKMAVASLIFTFILPLVILILGAIGGVTQMCSLVRNARALKKFNEKASRGDLKGISQTLDYLQGPRQRVGLEDAHAEEVAKFRLGRINFNDSHFTNEAHFAATQERMTTYRLTMQKAPEKLKQIPEWESLFSLVKGLEGLYQDLLLSKEGDEEELVERLLGFYEKLEDVSLDPTTRKRVQENKEELLLLKTEGTEIVTRGRSEIHRVLLYNVIFLLIALLIVSDGVVGLGWQKYQEVTQGLSIAAGLLSLSYILFDRKVSQEHFLELEKRLRLV